MKECLLAGEMSKKDAPRIAAAGETTKSAVAAGSVGCSCRDGEALLRWMSGGSERGWPGRVLHRHHLWLGLLSLTLVRSRQSSCILERTYSVWSSSAWNVQREAYIARSYVSSITCSALFGYPPPGKLYYVIKNETKTTGALPIKLRGEVSILARPITPETIFITIL